MKSRRIHLALLAAGLAACVDAAAAPEILRCVDARGAVTYQQVACPESAQAQRSGVPAEFPEPNHLERERLLAREAALDRRLEARRDRELLEAQMREARSEREAERERLAMLLAAQQAAQPQYFVVFPARPWVPAHRRHSAAAGTTNRQSIFR